VTKVAAWAAADRPAALHRMWPLCAALPDQRRRGAGRSGDHHPPSRLLVLRHLRGVLSRGCDRSPVHDCVRGRAACYNSRM